MIYDGRDKGNYLDYDGPWPELFDLLLRADPTGLAVGILIHEMIETTIRGSKVRLERVLRERGFVEGLHKILGVRERLMATVEAPMQAFKARIDEAMVATSSKLGKCTDRELAICLRDAIFCLEQGLTLRWILCAGPAPQAAIKLSMNVLNYRDLGGFAEELRSSLPFGAHLARIGRSNTAIGIKMPGRVGFLSSLNLDWCGNVKEELDRNWTTNEDLDLGSGQLRYPQWIEQKYSGSFGGNSIQQLRYQSIADLPRDRLMWFAMLSEIAAMRMAPTEPDGVELAEVYALALPAPQQNQGNTNLPALIQPNWQTKALGLQEALESLKLTPWELRFLAPALEGRGTEDFLPSGGVNMVLPFDGGPSFPYDPNGEHRGERIEELGVVMGAIALSWVGTRSETEAVRWSVLRENLVRYLFAWGNLRFHDELEAAKPWFREKFMRALPEAIAWEGASFSEGTTSAVRGVCLYRQSPRHLTYKPLCFFSGGRRRVPSEATHTATFTPTSSKQIIKWLGLLGEDDLPEFLRGWQIDGSWACTDRHASPWDNAPKQSLPRAPVESHVRWSFSKPHDSDKILATVAFNAANVPEHVRAALPKPTSRVC